MALFRRRLNVPQNSARASEVSIDSATFGVVSTVDEFMRMVREAGRVALRMRSSELWKTKAAVAMRIQNEYGKSSSRESDLVNAPLHCAGCLMEFPFSYLASLSGFFGVGQVSGASPGFRQFGQTGQCPQCGSPDSLLVYESFSRSDVTQQDVDRIRLYWRMLARNWWHRQSRNDAICDACNGPLSRDDGYLYGSDLICAGCADRYLAGAVEKLQRDPHCLGSALLRKVRVLR